ncbi:MAG: hypothetical protein JNK94_08475 [Hyphomonadaceae bacterium]|nr:hypothetical protein [Hyphomonadaceae bacterium]
MSARAWPIATLAFGVITLCVFVGFNFLPAVAAAYEPGRLAGALSLFQRAETAGDLVRVFGLPPNQAALGAMHAVNTLDLWGFIPAYAIFLCAGAMMLAGGARSMLALLAIVFALAGAAFDVVETAAQLRITADYDQAPAQLPIAPWHWLKYGALAANAWVMAAVCLLGAQKRWVLGVLCALPLPAVLLAWLELTPTRLFSITFALAWIALLVVAFRALLAAKGATAPGQTA